MMGQTSVKKNKNKIKSPLRKFKFNWFKCDCCTVTVRFKSTCDLIHQREHKDTFFIIKLRDDDFLWQRRVLGEFCLSSTSLNTKIFITNNLQSSWVDCFKAAQHLHQHCACLHPDVFHICVCDIWVHQQVSASTKWLLGVVAVLALNIPSTNALTLV